MDMLNKTAILMGDCNVSLRNLLVAFWGLSRSSVWKSHDGTILQGISASQGACRLMIMFEVLGTGFCYGYFTIEKTKYEMG